MIHVIKCIDCDREFDCGCDDYDPQSDSCSESDVCAYCREKKHGKVTPLDRFIFKRAVYKTDSGE